MYYRKIFTKTYDGHVRRFQETLWCIYCHFSLLCLLFSLHLFHVEPDTFRIIFGEHKIFKQKPYTDSLLPGNDFTYVQKQRDINNTVIFTIYWQYNFEIYFVYKLSLLFQFLDIINLVNFNRLKKQPHLFYYLKKIC